MTRLFDNSIFSPATGELLRVLILEFIFQRIDLVSIHRVIKGLIVAYSQTVKHSENHLQTMRDAACHLFNVTEQVPSLQGKLWKC